MFTFHSYSSGKALSEKCCLDGVVYLGSRMASKFLKPEFVMSFTINWSMAPDIALAQFELQGRFAAKTAEMPCLLGCMNRLSYRHSC